ncbi:MAG: TRAM domain-containing protein, partial [Proteobacteria bacterium]
MNDQIADTIQVTIEKLAIGGAGIARHDGLVIFVPDAAPGDQLLIKIRNKKKNFAEADILQVLVPGPSRRRPPCPIADRCGGCNWQHLTEQEQQSQKQMLVQETIGTLCHRLFALHINEAWIVLVLFTMRFPSCLFRIGRTRLEGFALV